MTFDKLSEIPPSLSYELSWASDAEKEWLLKEMRLLERQTMNIRVMAGARFLLLRDQGSVVGWAGLDISFNPRIAEIFSLHLYPDYRKYLLGLVLELARCTYLKENGYKSAQVRMTADTNSYLLNKRLESGIYRRLDPATLDAGHTGLCRKCELFGTACAKQAYLEVDIHASVESGAKRIGTIDISAMPLRFELRLEQFRKGPRVDETATPDAPKPYKPYWF